ncbi:hypothetical protein LRK_05225 [Lacticaseibacillus rhamnosus K32]|uniref:hypothetical protein n=1 Tax=Lacticaseibacillus rhamnosus TaxID=47715 RepID=UPI0004E312F2|nr:hypothetical protein [Lacticaseibacillus rhamnosus]KFC37267.1 hypothetical protein LRK_05225 [Lacticaseibacillus rhamnosus K32]WHM89479.1 hypothetical protein QJQ50_11670 [Lacticaseibacillus rhamnosus]
MTYFDKTIDFFAKTYQVSDLLEKDENDDFVFFKIRGLSAYNNLMHALIFLSAMAGFLEQLSLPLQIQVTQIPLSGNESKVDFIVTKLLKAEYRHAVQKLEKAVNQTNRNANGGK